MPVVHNPNPTIKSPFNGAGHQLPPLIKRLIKYVEAPAAAKKIARTLGERLFKYRNTHRRPNSRVIDVMSALLRQMAYTVNVETWWAHQSITELAQATGLRTPSKSISSAWRGMKCLEQIGAIKLGCGKFNPQTGYCDIASIELTALGWQILGVHPAEAESHQRKAIQARLDKIQARTFGVMYTAEELQQARAAEFERLYNEKLEALHRYNDRHHPTLRASNEARKQAWSKSQHEQRRRERAGIIPGYVANGDVMRLAAIQGPPQ